MKIQDIIPGNKVPATSPRGKALTAMDLSTDKPLRFLYDIDRLAVVCRNNRTALNQDLLRAAIIIEGKIAGKMLKALETAGNSVGVEELRQEIKHKMSQCDAFFNEFSLE